MLLRSLAVGLIALGFLLTACASDDAATPESSAGPTPPAGESLADATDFSRGDRSLDPRPTYDAAEDMFTRDPLDPKAPADWEIPDMPRRSPVAADGGRPGRDPVPASSMLPGAPTGESWDPDGGAAGDPYAATNERYDAANAPYDERRADLDAGRGLATESEYGSTARDRTDSDSDAGTATHTGGRRERAVTVIWEALATEKDKLLNSRYRRATRGGITPPTRTILINESHPAAARLRDGRNARAEAGTGIITDRQMAALVKSFQELGYFRVAKPTASMRKLFKSSGARGRVTIESDGTSYTLLSMRGQALNASTREIPVVYSKVKQAVAAMRNMTTSLTVSSASSGN